LASPVVSSLVCSSAAAASFLRRVAAAFSAYCERYARVFSKAASSPSLFSLARHVLDQLHDLVDRRLTAIFIVNLTLREDFVGLGDCGQMLADHYEIVRACHDLLVEFRMDAYLFRILGHRLGQLGKRCVEIGLLAHVALLVTPRDVDQLVLGVAEIERVGTCIFKDARIGHVRLISFLP
jgi:hypothetical protein